MGFLSVEYDSDGMREDSEWNGCEPVGRTSPGYYRSKLVDIAQARSELLAERTGLKGRK